MGRLARRLGRRGAGMVVLANLAQIAGIYLFELLGLDAWPRTLLVKVRSASSSSPR